MSTPEVDRVALVLFDAGARGNWASAPDSVKAFYRRMARAAIAALKDRPA